MADQDHAETSERRNAAVPGGEATPLDTYTTPPYAVSSTGSRYRPPSQAEILSNHRLAGILEQFAPRLADSLRACAEGGLLCNRTRICAICTRFRKGRLLLGYRTKLQSMSAPHLLTLTTFPTNHLTRDGVTQIPKAFSKLKRRARFKRAVAGGIASVELKHGEHGWLVHLHAVVDLEQALPKDWLKQAWTHLGGGYQVDLRPLESGTEVRAFIYTLKGAELPGRVEQVRQFVHATWGLRLVQPWGNLHSLHGRKRSGRSIS